MRRTQQAAEVDGGVAQGTGAGVVDGGARLEADRDVRRMALFYLVYYGAGGFYFPYLVLYLAHRGASAAAIGLIAALGPGVGLVTQPLWGHLADRRRAPLWLLRGLLLGGTVFICLVPLLPVPVGAAFGMSAYALFASPIVALADSSTLRFLAAGSGLHGADAYPRVRAYGSLSFSVSAVLSSLLYADQGLWRAFVAMGAGMVLCTLVLPRREPTAGAAPAPAGARDPGPPVGRALRQLVAMPAYVVVVLSAFLLQVANAAHATFFPVYLVAVHMPASAVGAPWAMAAVTEVPMFALLPPMASRVGIRNLVLASLVLYAARFLLYSAIHVAWPVFVVQLLQGFTFAFFTGGTVVLIGTMVPPGLKAVGQTVFMAVSVSLAAIVGNLGGGAAVSLYGVFAMYRLAAGVALLSAALFALGLRPWRPAPARPPAPAAGQSPA